LNSYKYYKVWFYFDYTDGGDHYAIYRSKHLNRDCSVLMANQWHPSDWSGKDFENPKFWKQREIEKVEILTSEEVFLELL